MYLKITLFVFFSFISTIIIHAQDIEWAYNFSGVSTPTIYSYDLEKDANNNIYVAGQYTGKVEFNPGPGQDSLVSTGSNFDLFFAKFDDSGNHIWAKSLGANNYSTITKILTDNSNNIYICGMFSGSVDFDPNSGVSLFASDPSNGYNAFFAKYNSDGNFIKVVILGGSSGNVVTDMEFDADANLVITGGLNGTVDFDPGIGVASLTSVGNSDIFFAKYDSNGNYIFAKSVGSTGNEGNALLSIDSGNNIYISGQFTLTSDFDPSSSSNNLTALGSNDIFFAAYDSDGNFSWVKSIGSSASEILTGLEVDDNSNIYLSIRYTGTVDFDPDAAVFNLTGTGTETHFFGKYNSSGFFQWGKSIGESSVIGTDITLNSSGNIFFTGRVWGTNDFDPNSGVQNLIGTDDSFFAAYDNSGNYLTAFSINSTGSNISDGLIVDDAGDIYVTGFFQGSIDFDPWASSYTLNAGQVGPAGFLAKYSSTLTFLSFNKEGPTITVFPNPAKDKIHVAFSVKNNYQIKVLNSQGEIVYQDTMESDQLTIDLHPGFYFLLINDDEGKAFTGKVLIE